MILLQLCLFFLGPFWATRPLLTHFLSGLLTSFWLSAASEKIDFSLFLSLHLKTHSILVLFITFSPYFIFQFALILMLLLLLIPIIRLVSWNWRNKLYWNRRIEFFRIQRTVFRQHFVFSNRKFYYLRYSKWDQSGMFAERPELSRDVQS